LTRIHQIAGRLDDTGQAITLYHDMLGAHYIASFDPPGLVFFDFEGTRLLR
jgi:methylmalonyl-CoA/ethylmalonyl-CoA epimerase